MVAPGTNTLISAPSGSITLTADTNIAAGTTVSIDSSGNAAQTWGPAPAIADTVTLFAGAHPSNNTGPSVLILDATHFVVFNNNVSASLGAQACSISGNVISMGPVNNAVPFVNMPFAWKGFDNNAYPSAVAMSSSEFVVFYNDPISGNVNAAACSIDGSNNITVGTPVQMDTQAVVYWGAEAIALSSTSFIFAAQFNDNTVKAIIGTLSGNAITFGSFATLTSAGNNAYAWLSPISSTEVLASYDDANNGANTVWQVLQISGTSITTNTVTVGAAGQLGLGESLNGSVFLSNAGQSGKVSGTTVTLGLSPASNPTLYPYNSSAQVQNFGSDFLIALNNQFSTPAVVAVNSGTLDISSVIEPIALPNNLFSPYGPLVPNGTTSFSFTMQGYGGSSSGTSLFPIYEESSSGVLSSPINHYVNAYWLYPLSTTQMLATIVTGSGQGNLMQARVVNVEPINSGPIGFSASAVSSGNSVTITLNNEVGGFSGLTPGTQYYGNGDGTITTADTGIPVGVALTSGTLLIGLE